MKLIDQYDCGHYSEVYSKHPSIYKIRSRMIPISTGIKCPICGKEAVTTVKVLTNKQFERKEKLTRLKTKLN